MTPRAAVFVLFALAALSDRGSLAVEELKDHYKTLGVARAVTDDEIKAAYRKLAKQWHPDKHLAEKKQEAIDRFYAIGEAYEVLGKSESRSEYDALWNIRKNERKKEDAANREMRDHFSQRRSWGASDQYDPYVTFANEYREYGGGSTKRVEEIFEYNGRLYTRMIETTVLPDGRSTSQAQDFERYGGNLIPVSDVYEYARAHHGGGDENSDEETAHMLRGGEVLKNGGGLTSRDASHHARLHYDGNLAVYEVNTGAEGGGGGDGYDDDYLGPLVWESKSYEAGKSFVKLQEEGMLIIGAGEDDRSMTSVIWTSNKRGYGDRCYMVLEPSGNLVVYELAPALGEGAGGAPECIWASNGCPGTLSGNARWVAYKMRMTVRRAIRYAVPEELGGGARGVFAIFGRFQGWLRSVFKR